MKAVFGENVETARDRSDPRFKTERGDRWPVSFPVQNRRHAPLHRLFRRGKPGSIYRRGALGPRIRIDLDPVSDLGRNEVRQRTVLR